MRIGLGSLFLLGLGTVATIAALWAIGHAYGKGEATSSRERLTVVYFAMLAVVVPGAIGLEFLVLTLSSGLGLTLAWLGIPLNVLPAFAAGWLFYTPFARRVLEISSLGATLPQHFRRCFGLYVLFLLLGAHMAVGARSSTYWLFGQVILWPSAAMLGGIIADLVQLRLRLRSAALMPNLSL